MMVLDPASVPSPYLGLTVPEAVLQDGVVTLSLPGEGVRRLLTTIRVAGHVGLFRVTYKKY